MSLDALLFVLLMLALGYGCARLRLFPDNTAEVLNLFALYLCLPAAVLRFVPKLQFSADIAVVALVPWLVLALSVALIVPLARMLKLRDEERAVLLLCVPLGNTSFLGYPLTEALLGRDAGWKAQRRDGAAMDLGEAVRFHWPHMLVGIAVTIVCWETSPGLLVWMAPVVLGLVLSGPLNWLTSQEAGPAMSAVLSTPVDRFPASVELRALRHTELWRDRLAAEAARSESRTLAAA